jgi:uncharacterized protein (TIGR00251 family)
MTEVTDLFEIAGDDVVLHVHVQPAAGRNAVVGRHGDALKLRIAAPPVDGRANTATAELIAETFGVKPATVAIDGGEASRTKRFRIKNLDAEEAEKCLRLALEDAARRPEKQQH